MSTVLEIPKLPSSLVLDPPLTDEEFENFCAINEQVQLERTREGMIVVNAPVGASTSDGNSEIIHQLRAWWKTHHRGRVFDSSAGFFLPDGSSLSPDAAYVTPEQLKNITSEDFQHFLHLAPAFVIELLSYSDRLSKAQEKIQCWIANGTRLGWLIDPYSRCVYIYEAASTPRTEKGSLAAGTGPAQCVVLDLTEVWICYE